MDATELQKENERLQAALLQAQAELHHATDQLHHTTNQLYHATAQHEAVTQQFTAQLEEKDRQVSSLEHQLKILLQQIRGSRQERIDPDQLLLFSVEELKAIAAELARENTGEFLCDDVAKSNRRERRKSPGRVGKLPEHLEREIIRHELSEQERACPCCGELRVEIGIEISEQLELIPAKLKAMEHHRVKYGCRVCDEHVAIAAKPPQPIEKGLPAPGLCAHTVLSKFGDHTPMYRRRRHSLSTGYEDTSQHTLWLAGPVGNARHGVCHANEVPGVAVEGNSHRRYVDQNA